MYGLDFRDLGLSVRGCVYYPLIMENQMENNIDHDAETEDI